MKKALIVLLVLFMLVGCSTYYTGTYLISLKEVERPEDSKVRYGKNEIVKFEEENQIKYSYEDEIIRIIWAPHVKQFAFQLNNQTNHSIKIIWDDAAYIDQNGSSHRIVHEGVKYSEMQNSQPPTIVVRNTKITDLLIPTDNIRYVSGQYGGWRISPLITKVKAETFSELDSLSSVNIDKTVSVLLPLKIEDVINEYIFKFNVSEFVADSTEVTSLY